MTATKSKELDLARSGRFALVGLAALGVFACEARCAGPAGTAESSPPAPASATAEDSPPASAGLATQVRITAAEVEEIARGELRMVEAPKYEVRKLGKPKVLMEGKFLRLSYEPWPLAPNRGFVVVEDGPNLDPEAPSAPLEARLLDLETGEVLAVLRTLYHGSYPKLGVARGEAEVDGTRYEVLVHASDGQIVPMWTVEQGKRRWPVINAGTGEAWVFERLKESRGSEDDEEPWYRYAFWPDLRMPPPEPTEPFSYKLDQDGFHRPGGWLGPTMRDPAAAPLFLETESRDACPKVEMKPDGHGCVPWETWAMVDGWRGRYDEEREVTVMSHAASRQEQVLEIGEKCKIQEVTLDPPRAVLRCNEPEDRFLWSPEKVVRVPREVLLGWDTWSWNRHVWEVMSHSNPDDLPIESTWIDLVALRMVRYHGIRNLTPDSMKRHLIFDDERLAAELYVADLAGGRAHRVPLDSRDCNDYSSLAATLPLSVYRCRDVDETTRWMGVIDVERYILWKSPQFHEVWLLPDDHVVIGSVRSGGRQRILRWELR